MITISSIRLQNFLSFGPNSEEIELRDLNVLIGPNGSGKSNFLDAFAFLAALPEDIGRFVRRGGGAREWVWKGEADGAMASLEVTFSSSRDFEGLIFRGPGRLRYLIAFAAYGSGLHISEEALRKPLDDRLTWASIYERTSFSERIFDEMGQSTELVGEIAPDQSVLKQRRDPRNYPELTGVALLLPKFLGVLQWTFGARNLARGPQRTDLPTDRLEDDASNLALLIHNATSSAPDRFDRWLARIIPQFKRVATRIGSGSVELQLYEHDFSDPIPAARLSDGTVRVLAMLAVLTSDAPPSLICIDEPELGLHPDAVLVIADLLREASRRTQLIVATHSPIIVSALSDDPESILTCERSVVGTQIRRLRRGELGQWLDKEYALGDAWLSGAFGANP